ncbi:MAG: type II toxin-antitoxin system RelE/ParE family toxin [Ilyomonas sp.]
MVKKEKRIVWFPEAKQKLREIISYIKNDSPQNAQKVKNDILEEISNIPYHPEKFPPDKYKLHNQNNAYRAFELHRIRVSYFLEDDEVMIIRIRHTKQEPLLY